MKVASAATCGRRSNSWRYVKNKAYMAGQTAPGGDFPASWPNFGAEALAVAGSRHLAQRRFFLRIFTK